MDKEILLSELDASTKNLFESLSGFNETNFNYNPSETGWSPAQITEHLLLLEIVANKALTGETIPTNRPPDKKIALIKWAMEDETKRVAPPVVIPSNTLKNVDELVQQLKKHREKLRAIAADADLSDACMSIKHPALGTLTKLEWVYFTICHCNRHVRQMNKIKASA